MTNDSLLHRWRDRARDFAQRLGHEVGDFITNHSEERPANRLLCLCPRCGRRVIVSFDADALQNGDANAVLIEGSATFQECRPNALRVIESKAWLLGESPTLLEPHLRRKLEELDYEHQERFDPGEFQPQRKRYLSDDGLLALQWHLRDFPQWPISQDNKQSVWGTVEVLQVVSEDDLMPARYIGPVINPNESEDEEDWLVVPLETDETGFAYRDDEGQWRFKRDDGTTGFRVNQSDFLLQRPFLDLDEDGPGQRLSPDNPQLYP